MNPAQPSQKRATWPELLLEAWRDTYATVHLWTQVAGKVRKELSPFQNHWWHVALYVTSRGLSTSPVPYGERIFEIDFDFLSHRLSIHANDGAAASFALEPMTVADFYAQMMAALKSIGVEVRIHTRPDELTDPILFEQDRVHRSYDPAYVERFWQILVSTSQVLSRFRSGFVGKCSPVQFFWGSFDLACTRFSGRRAPERPGADAILREAYSHEVASVGFWPGAGFRGPAFYAYTVPEPPGYAEARMRPESAFYSAELKEWILMYDEVRTSPSPERTLLEFCESTYEAGATLGNWDRAALERGS